MYIKLLKNWKNVSGRKILKGAEFTVTNELGISLIKKKIAKKAGPGHIEKLKAALRKKDEEDKEGGDYGK